MTIDSLQTLATMVLALSAANERLIEALKNLFAPFLAKKQITGNEASDPAGDRRRQLAVQILSVLGALCTAAWIAGGRPWSWGSSLPLGAAADAPRVPVVLLGLLTSGGSAFWNSVLDFTRGAAQLRKEKADIARRVNAGGIPVTTPGAVREAFALDEGSRQMAIVSVHL